MGKIDAHSLRIKMMAPYLHYLVTNRCTNALNQIEQIRKKIWVIFKFLLQILACIIKRHYIIDSLCTKEIFWRKQDRRYSNLKARNGSRIIGQKKFYQKIKIRQQICQQICVNKFVNFFFFFKFVKKNSSKKSSTNKSKK